MKEINRIIEYLQSRHLGYFDPNIKGKYLWRNTLNSAQSIKSSEELASMYPRSFTGFNMSIAETIPIKRRLLSQIKKAVKVQSEFITAINDITKLALKDTTNNYKFSRYIRNIIYYDIDKQEDRDLIRDLILTVNTPVSSARADMLSNGKFTEMQIASAGWNEVYELNKAVNPDKKNAILHNFYKVQQALTKKEDPIIIIYVNKGVGNYWAQMAGFAEALNEVVGKRCAYVSGPDGMKYKDGQLLFEGVGNFHVSVDSVYSLGDIRRIVKEGYTDLLKATLDKKIIFQPTVNPLLNNYQLALSLLNNELTADWFKFRLGISTLNKIRKYCVEYYAVSSTTNFDSFFQSSSVDFRVTPVGRIISRRQRGEYMYRLLLTKRLGSISGGWGIERLSNVKNNDELYRLIEDSMSASVLLGSLDKADFEQDFIGLSKYHRSRLDGEVQLFKNKDKIIENYTIKEPTILFEIFCLDKGRGLEYEEMYAYYSDPMESGFHIGGQKRAMGCVRIDNP